MNKWQIICPVVAMMIVGSVLGVIGIRNKDRGIVRMYSHSIGGDLIRSTNSSQLVRIGPGLQARLSEILGARTHVAGVLLGDAPTPIGDGTACSRLLLTNDLGNGLLIRLRRADKPGMFHVLGFQSISE